MHSKIEIPNKEEFTIKLTRKQLDGLCDVLAEKIRHIEPITILREGEVFKLDFYDAIMEQCGIQETSTDRFLYRRAYRVYKDKLYEIEKYEDVEEDDEY